MRDEGDVDDAAELREMTARLLYPPGLDEIEVPDDAELDELVSDLGKNFARYSEIGPVPPEWRDVSWFFAHPDHPFSSRSIRQKAASGLRRIAAAHPDLFDADLLPALHTALFDVSAAVAEDICTALGILRRDESREPLERFHALMKDERGWGPVLLVCRWALKRITDSVSVEPRIIVGAPGVVDVKEIGPDTVQLVCAEDRMSLRNPDTGVEIQVSAIEARVFQRSSESRLSEFFRSAGGLEATDPASRLGDVARGLARGLPTGDVLSTLVDTTTVHMGIGTVNEEWFRPEGIFDLSTLVYCCVMYDFVLVDADHLVVPPELSDVVIPVRPYETQAFNPRWDIAVQRRNEIMSTPGLQEEIDRSWTRALGRQVHVDFLSFDDITESPNPNLYVPGSPFGFYDPVEASMYPDDLRLSRDVSIQTYRYLINEKIAETLGVAYNCTSLRNPIESLALARRSAHYQVIDEFLHRLAPTSGAPLKRPTGTGPLAPIVLPHPLAIVLSRSERREQIWEETRKLRDRLEPVREAFRAGRLEGRLDPEMMERLLREVLPQRDWVSKTDTVIQIISAIAAATPEAEAFARVGFAALAVMRPGTWLRRGARWALRPELQALRGFHHDAQLISDRTADLERLWGQRPNRAWIDAAARLSETSSRRTGGLRQRD